MSVQDIQPEQLIDTSENKPLEQIPEQTTTQNVHDKMSAQVPAKNINQLTPEEKLTIINNAKNGIENDFYKVQFYKNGNSRIVKRKQPATSTSENIIKQRAPGLTTEQLLMEHVIGLESQLATLRQKQKRLKHNYKSLYQDIYVDDDEISQSNKINMTPINNALNPNTDNNDNQHESQPQNVHDNTSVQDSPEFPQQNITFPQIKRNGWRARIPIYG